MSDFVEFGNIVNAAPSVMWSNPTYVVNATLDYLITSYGESKFLYFPSWRPEKDGGEFSLRVFKQGFGPSTGIAWYAAVPKEFVIQEEDLL
jgi:hypothetical protein